MTVSYNNDPEYAISRLRGSYVMHNNIPVMVDSIEGDGDVICYPMYRGREFITTLDSLDLEPFQLGYANGQRSSMYLTRLPARQWRQGLRNGNYIHVGRRFRMETNSKEMLNTILNRYPNLSHCVESVVNGESTSRAFSRDFSVFCKSNGRLFLEYKSKQVGILPKRQENDNFQLEDNFQYLSEVLEEQSNANS